MNKVHFADNYLYNSRHPITVNVIGVGGNGTNALYALAKMNLALLEMGRQGLSVVAFDDDKVEEHNLVRQSFTYQDVGQFKADVIISRINRFYGFDWKASINKYDKHSASANIIIGCTDTLRSREIINNKFKVRNTYFNATSKPYYYLDIGNTKDKGQVVLGSQIISQPKSKIKTVKKLKTFFEEFTIVEEDKNEPSCSIYQSLSNQGLFTNSALTTFGMELLWKLLFENYISYRGVYMNLEKMQVKPIPL